MVKEDGLLLQLLDILRGELSAAATHGLGGDSATVAVERLAMHRAP